MNKRALFVVLSILLIGVCTPIPLVCAQADWLEGWNNRIDITIDSDDVDEVLTDFPVLVYLNSSRITWSAVQDDLDDLRFCDEDSTVLKYEIDHYTVNDEAWLWVKILTISNTSNTVFTLFYNNTEAEYGEDPENVWDAHFIFVCHMNDATTSTILDSTVNDNDGVKKGANEPIETTNGKIDGAQNFDGGDDQIIIAETASMNFTAQATLECWIYPTNLDQAWESLIVKRGTGNSWALQLQTGNDIPMITWWKEGGGILQSSATSTPLDNNWYYLTATYDGTTSIFYFNGTSEDSDISSATLALSDADVSLGYRKQGNDEFYQGYQDEVRISNTTRSPSWVKASYESQRYDILFFGSEGSRPVVPLSSFNFIIGIVALSLSVTAFLGISNKRRR